jgi:hypothetical protein
MERHRHLDPRHLGLELLGPVAVASEGGGDRRPVSGDVATDGGADPSRPARHQHHPSGELIACELIGLWLRSCESHA